MPVSEQTSAAPMRYCPSCGKTEHGSIACHLAPDIVEVSPGVTIWRYPTTPLQSLQWQV